MSLTPENLASFVETAKALSEIRDRRLYRDQFPTFDAYCRSHLGISGKYATDLIGIAEQYAARGLS